MTTRSTRTVAMLTGIAALLGAPATSTARQAESRVPDAVPFITAEGDQLREGEAPFRFVSFNIPNLHYVEDDMAFEETNPWRFPDEFEISDALEAVRQQGGTVVRFYTLSVRKAEDRPGIPRHVLGPGEFDEDAFRALDRVMEVAGRKGIRVVVPFVDQWGWWGGIADYAAFRDRPPGAFYTDPELIQDFKLTIRHLVTRINTLTGVAYRDDPTLLCWETGNELASPDEWTAEIAAYVKSLDSNHLVLDGYNTNNLRVESLHNPHVDLVTTHHYERDPVDMIRHVRESAARARGRKPYFVGEFGFISRLAVADVLEAVIEEGVAGALIWSLRYRSREGGFYWHSEPSGGDHFKAYHWPGFDSGEAYDEREVMRLMQSSAFRIRGLPVPEPEVPAVPLLLPPRELGGLSWQGSAGATGYDVERAPDVEGPWEVVAGGVSDAAVAHRPLFHDASAEPGERHYYRVRARNAAGASEPSNTVGPVEYGSSLLVDELRGWSKIYSHSPGLSLQRTSARRAKEDFDRLLVKPGSFVVYKVDAPIRGFRAYAFFPGDVEDFAFSLSEDGGAYVPVDVTRRDYFEAGEFDAAAYGYWRPISYVLEEAASGARYLRIEFPTDAELSRIEIRYGGAPQAEEPATAPSSS
jgi:mannan endo-1,4-beta-mannosidase